MIVLQIERQIVHRGLERADVFVLLDTRGERVPCDGHARDEVQYVAVVATTWGGTNTDGCAAAALVCLRVGARAGQIHSRWTGADLCTIRCMAARAATERR